MNKYSRHLVNIRIKTTSHGAKRGRRFTYICIDQDLHT